MTHKLKGFLITGAAIAALALASIRRFRPEGDVHRAIGLAVNVVQGASQRTGPRQLASRA